MIQNAATTQNITKGINQNKQVDLESADFFKYEE